MLIKKGLTALALVTMVALLTSAAAAGSARNWQHNGAGLSGNVNIVTHSTMFASSSQGGFHCPVTASITLQPGSTGTVTSYAIPTTAACTYTGVLDTLCGVVDTHASTGLPWTVHATKFSGGRYGIVITGMHMDVGGTDIFCPDLTISGAPVMYLDPHGGESLEMEGILSSNIGAEMSVSGTAQITPSGTYKIAT